MKLHNEKAQSLVIGERCQTALINWDLDRNVLFGEWSKTVTGNAMWLHAGVKWMSEL